MWLVVVVVVVVMNTIKHNENSEAALDNGELVVPPVARTRTRNSPSRRVVDVLIVFTDQHAHTHANR